MVSHLLCTYVLRRSSLLASNDGDDAHGYHHGEEPRDDLIDELIELLVRRCMRVDGAVRAKKIKGEEV
jgi:hypothetical protein